MIVDESVDFIELVIISEMNNRLTRDVEIEQVKAVVFNLGHLKAPRPPDGFNGLSF